MILMNDFFGLVQVDATTGEYLCSCLKDSSITLGILFSYCSCQGYDGVRSFQGALVVLPKNMNKNKSAFTVHCLAGCVNLCLQYIARDCKCIKYALNFAMEVMQFKKYSPKQKVVLEKSKISMKTHSPIS